MENRKNKIVFAGVLVTILLFLISYSYLVFSKEDTTEQLSQPALPEWQETENTYKTKLEAIDALKETTSKVPSQFPEHMIDNKGYFNPDYMEYEKHRIIDSIYQTTSFKRPEQLITVSSHKAQKVKVENETNASISIKNQLTTDDFVVNHQLFFAANPNTITSEKNCIKVEVFGTQVVKKNERIQMVLTSDYQTKGCTLPAGTKLLGTVSFKPNRLLISITQIGSTYMQWDAYDLEDGFLGVYVQNSFRERAKTEVIDDVVQDINIAGVPQVNGVKSLFQRSNRNVKVTLLDGHKLILKPKNNNL